MSGTSPPDEYRAWQRANEAPTVYSGSGTHPDPRELIGGRIVPGVEPTDFNTRLEPAQMIARLAARLKSVTAVAEFLLDEYKADGLDSVATCLRVLLDENGLTARESEPTKGGL